MFKALDCWKLIIWFIDNFELPNELSNQLQNNYK